MFGIPATAPWANGCRFTCWPTPRFVSDTRTRRPVLSRLAPSARASRSCIGITAPWLKCGTLQPPDEDYRMIAAMTTEEIRARVKKLGPWFHNIDLSGVQTAPQHFLGDYPAVKWRSFADAIPRDLRGKIGRAHV